ncbi:protein-disulfide reductase DsbD [Pseudomonas sediminis]|uniref:Thiol:disulfide interchange protein DsbD n=1 Tax=Pseudomonas sediminis TaxID=1691904 RepID=A0ABX6SKE2_9PSED|nr:protein-disulfide reductase DsbD [Pseudomonas sediminis]QNH02261.1 protein-disulfide reductase DsbD [Pseudomonas sediminis]
MRLLVVLLSLFCSAAFASLPIDGLRSGDDFLAAEQAFVLDVQQQSEGETTLSWDIAPGYYLYQQRLKFTGLSDEQAPELPPGLAHEDEYFGASQIYRERLQLTLPAAARGRIEVQWQGCADAGLCYPPQTRMLDLGGTGATEAGRADDLALLDGLQQQALWLSMAVFFGLGLLLAFTPCSLPMLPILAGIVVGSRASPSRGFALAGTYTLSMALVYALLGVLAAALGANLQSLLQQPWLIGSFATLFVLLALPMFGFFELQLPTALRDRLERVGRGQQGGSLVGAVLLGVLSGLLVGPCMTAPLAAALLFIGQSGDLLQGGLVLFALGLGIGTPLVLLVTLGNRLLPKPGLWMERVKVVFGFLFLATALYLLRPLLAESIWLALSGAWLILAASSLVHLSAQLQAQRALAHAGAALLGLWGVAMLLGAAAGGSDPLRPLGVFTAVAAPQAEVRTASFVDVREPEHLQRELYEAKAQGQWVLVDYYADWCVSCKVMEREVFGNTGVQARLADARKLRLDVTASGAASRELLSRYQVLGPPTLLLIGPDGEERRQQRITGEADAQQFLRVWDSTMERG